MTQNKIVPPGTTEDTVKRGNSWQEITERKDCGNTEETGGSSSTDWHNTEIMLAEDNSASTLQ